jgi:hypothetical protein
MMASTTATPEITAAGRGVDLSDPRTQAFLLLRIGFTAAPILFGLDKFFDVMVVWPTYLWSGIDSVIPGSAHDVMLLVGVVEILAGLLVAVRPRIGGYVVAAWLAGIIVNLLAAGGFLDIVLRDVGLLLGALALARLATVDGPSDTTPWGGQ